MYLQNARVTIQITQSISEMTFFACGKYSLQFQWNEMISKWVKMLKKNLTLHSQKVVSLEKKHVLKPRGKILDNNMNGSQGQAADVHYSV